MELGAKRQIILLQVVSIVAALVFLGYAILTAYSRMYNLTGPRSHVKEDILYLIFFVIFVICLIVSFMSAYKAQGKTALLWGALPLAWVIVGVLIVMGFTIAKKTQMNKELQAIHKQTTEQR